MRRCRFRPDAGARSARGAAPSLTVEQRKQELAVLKRRLADLRARYDATKRRDRT